MVMDRQETDDFSCSQYQSNYTMSPPFSNQSIQSNPLPQNAFNYTMPSQCSNQSIRPNPLLQPIYHFNPANGTYPSHIDLHNASKLSFQGLLNTPTSTIQNSSAPKGQKKRAKCTENTDMSQASIIKKDWSKEEEVALTKAWLNVSVDSIIGNSQKNAALWVRIHKVWKENMGLGCKTLRTSNSLQCHWGKIHPAVSNFVGHYDRLARHLQSGSNTQDLIKKAMNLYEDIEGSEFKFVHCWEIMIKNPKWYSKHEKKMSSNKENIDDNNSPTVEKPNAIIGDNVMAPEGTTSDGVMRPEGRKSCKEKKRKLHDEKGVVDALNKLQCTLEKQIIINEASLEMRRQNELKDFQLKEQVMQKELELKENIERRKRQERFFKLDVSKLSPTVQAAYEAMQAKILKEWENEELFGTDLHA